MSLEQLLNQPLTLIHRGQTGTDQYGNDVAGTTSTEGIVGYIEQTDATELTVDRETYTSNHRAFLPADTQVTASDQLTDDQGNTYEVIGPPDTAYNPRLRKVSHIVAHLRVTTG